MAFAVASVMATAKAPAVQAKAHKTETLTSENASTTMADEDTGPADDVLPLSDGGTVFSENAQAGEDIVPEAGEDIGPEGAGTTTLYPSWRRQEKRHSSIWEICGARYQVPGPTIQLSSSAAQLALCVSN